MASAGGAQPTGTQPVVRGGTTLFRVTLKQIDRLYDIDATMCDPAGDAWLQPEFFMVKNVAFGLPSPTVFQRWRSKSSGSGVAKKTEYVMECFGDDGRKLETPSGGAGRGFRSIESRDLDEPVVQVEGSDGHAGSVRCTIEREGWGRQWSNRTFDRRKSTSVSSRSWVYVLRGTLRDPRKATLIKELQFGDQGAFRVAIPDREKETRLWTTDAKGSATARSADLDAAMRAQGDLELELEHPDSTTGELAEYYFYLARWRLPWGGVLALEQWPVELATRLGDLFFTDAYGPGEDPASATPILMKPKGHPQAFVAEPQILAQKHPSYVLHLCDPLLEATRRSDDLGRAIDVLDPAQNQVFGVGDPQPGQPATGQQSAPDRHKYQFAKHLELFTVNSDHDRAIIREKLGRYLYQDGGFERIDRIWVAIHSRAYDVVSWLGQRERRYLEEAHWDGIHFVWGDVLKTTVKERLDPDLGDEHRRAKQEQLRASGSQAGGKETPDHRVHFFATPCETWGNAYAAAMSLYRGVADEILVKIVEADCALKARIIETSVGQSYLDRDLGKYLARSTELQKELGIDANQLSRWKAQAHVDASILDLVLGAKATSGAMSDGWSNANAIYSGAWARKLRAFTLKLDREGDRLLASGISRLDKAPGTVGKLKALDEKVTGELERKGAKLISTLQDRAGLSPSKALEATGGRRVSVEERHTGTPLRGSKIGQASLGVFSAGLNAWVAIIQIREAKTVHELLTATGTAASAVKSGAEAVATIRRLAVGKPMTIAFVKPLGVFANVVGVVGSGWDILESHDTGEAIGRSISFGSALLGTYGTSMVGAAFPALAGASWPALVIAAICMLLDYTGKTIAAEYGDVARFLRACEFGNEELKTKVSLLAWEYEARLPGEALGNKYLKAKQADQEAVRANKPGERRWTIDDQHQALRELMYELKATLWIDPNTCEQQLLLVPWYLHCFTAEVSWSGSLTITQESIAKHPERQFMVGAGHVTRTDVKLPGLPVPASLATEEVLPLEDVLRSVFTPVTVSDDMVVIDDSIRGFRIDLGKLDFPSNKKGAEPVPIPEPVSLDRVTVDAEIELYVPGDTEVATRVLPVKFRCRAERSRAASY